MSGENSIDLTVWPRVEIAGDLLIAEFASPETKPAKPAAFYQFVALNPADETAILEFAQRWGMMGICEHGLPAAHTDFPGLAMLGVKGCFPCKLAHQNSTWLAEPIAFWRRCIKKAIALQRIGAAITAGENGQRDDWMMLWDHLQIQGREPWKRSRQAGRLGRALVAGEIQQWLDIGGVRPSFSWDNQALRWVTRQASPRGSFWPLFGWLGLRLMTEISGGRTVICPYCTQEYFPQRLPGQDQDHHCTKKECTRAYFRNYRRNQRKGAK